MLLVVIVAFNQLVNTMKSLTLILIFISISSFCKGKIILKFIILSYIRIYFFFDILGENSARRLANWRCWGLKGAFKSCQNLVPNVQCPGNYKPKLFMHKSCNELQIGNQFPNWSQRKSKLHSLCKNLNEVGTIFNYCN